MMKSKRFEPIQEIASTSAKDLSRAMAEAGRKVADLERQLEQLQSYRDEYVRKRGIREAASAVERKAHRSGVAGQGRRSLSQRRTACGGSARAARGR
jgi:flagellar biosynthesis chaperone FliJ